MALELSYRTNQNYLDIELVGIITPGHELDEMISAWKKIFILSNQHGLTKILSRIKVKGRFPLNAQINLALQVKDLGCTKMHRIASLAYSDQLYREQELIVNYVRAQGYNCHLFRYKDEAMSWLLKSPGKEIIEDVLSPF